MTFDVRGKVALVTGSNRGIGKVNSITQGLRDKLSAQGTLVISVHPGPIESDMATSAGLAEIAEPPSLVANGIIAALAAGDFHVFPDSMAKDFWKAYASFAKSMIESEVSEG